MWRHAHDDEGAKAHSLAIVNVSMFNKRDILKSSCPVVCGIAK